MNQLMCRFYLPTCLHSSSRCSRNRLGRKQLAQETVYLLRSPENAHRLMDAVARDKASRTAPSRYTSNEELKEMAWHSLELVTNVDDADADRVVAFVWRYALSHAPCEVANLVP
jgi:hypothetical protein